MEYLSTIIFLVIELHWNGDQDNCQFIVFDLKIDSLK